MERKLTLLLIALMLVMGAGCSAQTGDPLRTDGFTGTPNSGQSAQSDRMMLGKWEVKFDSANLTAEVSSVREMEGHYNVTTMIMPPECADCVLINFKGFDPVTNVVDVDFTLRNQFNKIAYDVRGIMMIGDIPIKLMNSDDWTMLYDYIGGRIINPFRAFAKDQPLREFTMGATYTENYLIKVPDPLNIPNIVFAVDASWPGNCLEPYEISNFMQVEPLGSTKGSTAALQVNSYDWQGSPIKISIVAPIISGLRVADFRRVSSDTWQYAIRNVKGVPAGEYRVELIARSADSGASAIYDYVTITITD